MLAQFLDALLAACPAGHARAAGAPRQPGCAARRLSSPAAHSLEIGAQLAVVLAIALTARKLKVEEARRL